VDSKFEILGSFLNIIIQTSSIILIIYFIILIFIIILIIILIINSINSFFLANTFLRILPIVFLPNLILFTKFEMKQK